jgi:hypothetical protein
MTDDREALMQRAKGMGLNPHHMTGAAKLKEMIVAAGGVLDAPPVEAAPEPETRHLRPGYIRVRVRKDGADRISTGERVANRDVLYALGDEFDIEAALADHYIEKNWVDPV